MKGIDGDIQNEENQLKLTETKKNNNSLKLQRKYIRQTAKPIIIDATQRGV